VPDVEIALRPRHLFVHSNGMSFSDFWRNAFAVGHVATYADGNCSNEQIKNPNLPGLDDAP
jgi:hypothetical protein